MNVKCTSKRPGFTADETYTILGFNETSVTLMNDDDHIVSLGHALINGEGWELQGDKPKGKQEKK